MIILARGGVFTIILQLLLVMSSDLENVLTTGINWVTESCFLLGLIKNNIVESVNLQLFKKWTALNEGFTDNYDKV